MTNARIQIQDFLPYSDIRSHGIYIYIYIYIYTCIYEYLYIKM